jgi:hypothetical protein
VGFRLRLGLGVGSWFEFDRGAQLVDCGHGCEFGVVGVGSVGGVFGDDPDPVEGQQSFAQSLRAARELLEPTRDGDHRLGVARGGTGFPGHQRGERAGTGHPAQVVVVQFGDDLDEATVDRIALTCQLRHLVEQRLHALRRYLLVDERSRGRCHVTIIAAGSDKSS